jgi:hypothetical protein
MKIFEVFLVKRDIHKGYSFNCEGIPNIGADTEQPEWWRNKNQ